jgi:hypothetical protein
MSGILTHKAVMLLARERLQQIKALLTARVASGLLVHPLEQRILLLADQALTRMGELPHAEIDFPDRGLAPAIGRGVSKFAVLGSMGPAIPGFSRPFVRNHEWVFDLLHKGSPDADHERVVAQTTDFVLELRRQIETQIVAQVPAAEQAAERKKADAYLLGHLCHLAGDIVLRPFLDGVRWQRTAGSRKKIADDSDETKIEVRVAERVFLRDGAHGGQRWTAWWPDESEVKPYFWTAWHDTLERIYHSQTLPPAGFPDFLERMRADAPPAESVELLRSGWRTLRDGVLPLAYDHGAGFWIATLLPLFLPLWVAPILAAYGTDHARLRLQPDSADSGGELAWYELLNLPVGLTSWIVPIYALFLFNPFTTRENDGYGWFSLVASFVSAILAAIGMGASFGKTNKDISPVARWLVFFALPMAPMLVHLVAWFRDLSSERRDHRLVPTLYLIPLFGFVAFLVLFAILFIAGAGSEGTDPRDLTKPGDFWWRWVIYFVVLVAVWIGTAFGLRDARVPDTTGHFDAEDPRFVRLVDDTSLFHEKAGTALFYPSGRRKLLKLWFEGTGDLYVRPMRNRVELSTASDGSAGLTTVLAPIAPVTIEEWATLLRRTVPGIKTQLAMPADADYVLPTGEVFADRGDDDDAALSAHDAAAASFVKLATTADASDYFLYHAPKSRQAIRFGSKGPRLDTTAEAAEGYSLIADASSDLFTGESLMDYAADLGALMCMGLASHMLPDPARTAGGVNKVYQVFRNWNLDRRRVNEWRMLVSGAAVSEKLGHPDRRDVAMSAELTDAFTAPTSAGEEWARKLGWVNLLRRWMDVARRPTVDTQAATSFRPGDPTNQQLSQGMAFLLDLPVP